MDLGACSCRRTGLFTFTPRCTTPLKLRGTLRGNRCYPWPGLVLTNEFFGNYIELLSFGIETGLFFHLITSVDTMRDFYLRLITSLNPQALDLDNSSTYHLPFFAAIAGG